MNIVCAHGATQEMVLHVGRTAHVDVCKEFVNLLFMMMALLEHVHAIPALRGKSVPFA